MMFTDFGLDAQLLRALEEEGYATPTPIQTQAIPGVLAGRDLLGIAQTGTGKTAAFALPILTRLAADGRETRRGTCRVLILSPTRELATQIGESFRTYGRHMQLSVAVVFGGVGHRPQIDTLRRGVDILVATPGRLIDHLDERNVSLEAVETFVLDEADQMLDLGFIRPIRNIVSRVPKARQSLFFSATMPFEIGALAAELLTDPLRVSVAPAATTVERVNQRVIFIEQKKKRALLARLLADPAMMRTIVFTRTKRGADRVSRHLEEAGISAAAIHGNKSQPQREKSLASFRDGNTRVLVATDIAARGIDIDQVTHVINFELPEVPESYVHRIGRTARAGAEGSAIALVDAEERGLLRDIERLTRQQIPSEDRLGDETLTADVRGSGGLRRGRDRAEETNGGSDSRGSRRRDRSGGRRSFGDRQQRHDERGARGAGNDRRPERSAERSNTTNGGGTPNGEANRFDQRRDDRRPDREHGYNRGRPEGARGDGQERPRESGDRSSRFARRDDSRGERPHSRDDRKQSDGGRDARRDQNGRNGQGGHGRPYGGDRSHANNRDRDHGAARHGSNDRRDGAHPHRNASDDRPRDDRNRAPVRFGGEARSNGEGRDGHRSSEHRDTGKGERPFRARDNNGPRDRDQRETPRGRDGREHAPGGHANDQRAPRRDHGDRHERPSRGESRPHRESRNGDARSDRGQGPRDGARQDQRTHRGGDRNRSGNGGHRPFRPNRQGAERAD